MQNKHSACLIIYIFPSKHAMRINRKMSCALHQPSYQDMIFKFSKLQSAPFILGVSQHIG